MTMRGGMRKLVIIAVCAAAYLGWPYASIYWIATAMQRGDAQTLAADIEWDGVREGLKEDIADGITGQPGSSTAVASDALPAFGSGFVRSMAGNMVDETVTPEHLATSFSALQAAGANHTGLAIDWAWFTSPTSFEARFRLPDAASGAAPVRVRLELVQDGWGLGWRVTRAWIPTPVLEHWETRPS